MTARRPDWVDPELFPFTSRFADLAGNQIHYVDEGSGPTLLMLHGNPVWSFVYRDVITALRDRYRCVALDFPGFGLSTAGPDFGYRAHEQAQSLLAFVDHLNLSNVTVIGHNWGGPFGLYAAEQRPTLARRLVLSNTWSWPLNGDPSSELFSRGMGNPIGRALLTRFNPLVERFIPAAHKRRKLSHGEMAHYRHATARPSQRAAATTLPGELVGARPFFNDLVENLDTVRELPTLILWGEHDPIFTRTYRERLQETFPNHATTVLPGTGHFVQSDAPDEFAHAVDDWHR